MRNIKPVIQEESTGCAIASAAALAGLSYAQAKVIANGMGIFAEDSSLWSETAPMLNLLDRLGLRVGDKTVAFTGWESLPHCALLSTKWHLINGRPFWHWVVFVRDKDQMAVLDSKKSLKTHIRTDFGRIRPKWFIEVMTANQVLAI